MNRYREEDMDGGAQVAEVLKQQGRFTPLHIVRRTHLTHIGGGQAQIRYESLMFGQRRMLHFVRMPFHDLAVPLVSLQ